MTTAHLIGYPVIVLLLLLLMFAIFAESITSVAPWVRRLAQTQKDWRQLRVDLTHVTDFIPPPPAVPIGRRLEDLGPLPASGVFRNQELEALAQNYHSILTRQTWKIFGASAFPSDRVYEVANHLRVYVIFFLLLVGYNIIVLVPESKDLTFLLTGSAKQLIHNGAGFLGENVGKIIAVKEALIIGFFSARLYSERSVFLHFAKD